MEIDKSIRKYALMNAVEYKGKANPGAVIGKILSEHPESKDNMKAVSMQINKIIKEVNAMTLDAQTKELLRLVPDHFESEKQKKDKRKEDRKELPELKNAVMGHVLTRIAPEPSKYNHLGHAVSFLINYMYAQKYQGKCILRFEDTNPDKSTQEYADAMQSDVLEYLDIKADKTVHVSDHIDKYYEFGQRLITEGKAYSCTCTSEEISAKRRDMLDCKCRSKSIKEVQKDWEEMKKGKMKAEAMTLRLKIDMAHKNAVMRDPVIFRLCYSPHYRQGTKYKVWPMYDFENAIEEGSMGITHVFRSNEFESRIELQDYIRGLFSLPNPEIRQYARFNITGAVTQGREIRKLIESGDYLGWDDPRLVTLRALKRRGIVKEAFYELTKVIGMSKSSHTLDFSVIASINRKLLDEKAFRFFFIPDYQEVTVKGAKENAVELDLHPTVHEGGRKFKTKDKFYLSKADLAEIKDGEMVRLMDCLNTVKKGNDYLFDSFDIDTFRKKGSKRIIHWLPKDDTIVNVEILMPDNTITKGYAEGTVKILEEGDVVQFERYGFCRLDAKSKDKLVFWYTHK